MSRFFSSITANFQQKAGLLLRKKSTYLFSLFWILIFAIFFANGLHEKYPDEFDNILGGWDILHGRLIYTGFFTHHGPFPYFLAGFVEIFSGRSFVRFREVYSLLLGGYFVFTYFLLQKLTKGVSRFYITFIGIIGLVATYYWFHMLLADNVAASVFVVAYAILLIKAFHKKVLTLTDIVTISSLSSIGLYSSLTYTYLYGFLVLFTLWVYYSQYKIAKKFFLTKIAFLPLLLFIAPHIAFLIYLLLTGSLKDYIYQNYTFNTQYYIYNYPRSASSTTINPIRFAIVIAHGFINNFYILLSGARDFGFAFPLNVTMAVANGVTILYLLLKREYKLALLVFLLIIYANARSNPLDSKETDYQSAVYILLSFFNLTFVLPQLFHTVSHDETVAKRVVSGFLMTVLGIYAFFGIFFIFNSFQNKMYDKYMGQAPLIYNRPEVAPIINSIITNNDYMWIGPFEFEELFYANGRVPSKYHILIPGMAKSDKVKQEFLADFEKNKPVVIFFDPNFYVLGSKVGTYGDFFVNFLNKNYYTMLTYTDAKGRGKYQSLLPHGIDFKADLDAKLYIRKDKMEEIAQKLVANGYIRQIPR